MCYLYTFSEDVLTLRIYFLILRGTAGFLDCHDDCWTRLYNKYYWDMDK